MRFILYLSTLLIALVSTSPIPNPYPSPQDSDSSNEIDSADHPHGDFAPAFPHSTADIINNWKQRGWDKADPEGFAAMLQAVHEGEQYAQQNDETPNWDGMDDEITKLKKGASGTGSGSALFGASAGVGESSVESDDDAF